MSFNNQLLRDLCYDDGKVLVLKEEKDEVQLFNDNVVGDFFEDRIAYTWFKEYLYFKQRTIN